ncbi:MAG: hypothetical protein II936_07870 [Oscillospiraceae bacterium]|nr:hypothetical protein [Oscillospiraceae bacterium]
MQNYPTFFYFLKTIADDTPDDAFEYFESFENEEKKKALLAEAVKAEQEDIYELSNFIRRNYSLNIKAKRLSYIIGMIIRSDK